MKKFKCSCGTIFENVDYMRTCDGSPWTEIEDPSAFEIIMDLVVASENFEFDLAWAHAENCRTQDECNCVERWNTLIKARNAAKEFVNRGGV